MERCLNQNGHEKHNKNQKKIVSSSLLTIAIGRPSYLQKRKLTFPVVYHQSYVVSYASWFQWQMSSLIHSRPNHRHTQCQSKWKYFSCPSLTQSISYFAFYEILHLLYNSLCLSVYHHFQGVWFSRLIPFEIAEN